MELGDNQGKCTEQVAECNGRLGNHTKLDFAADEKGGDNQGRDNLDHPVIAGGAKVHVSACLDDVEEVFHQVTEISDKQPDQTSFPSAEGHRLGVCPHVDQ